PGTITIQWYIAAFASGVFVQRGETTVDTGSPTWTNATLGTYVGTVAQAFTLFSSTPAIADAPAATWDSNDPIVVELTTPTNVQFRTDLVANHIVAWQVVQWTNAAEINVQKGSLTTSTTPTTLMGTGLNVTVTLPSSYVMKKSFPLVSMRTTTPAAPNDVH